MPDTFCRNNPPSISPSLRLLTDLSIHCGESIDHRSDLIVFDEIQACPRAITSLKYFYESLPGTALCCAGSLLGVALSAESFPVGKVAFLDLYPMSFTEFLKALNEEVLLDVLASVVGSEGISLAAHGKLWERLKDYYIVGGMPQAVLDFVSGAENKASAFKLVRLTQKQLIDCYVRDFAKYSGKTNSMHIVSVFEDIPRQLSRNFEGSVKRYQFKNVIPKKKSYSELRGPIDWLEKAGLMIKVKICNRAEIPLEAFCKQNLMKLYFFDIGLLGCMLDLPIEAVISQDYGITKGYFAENFVAQEFRACGIEKIYAWTERNSEIEFLRVINNRIVPIEVKAGTRTQAKSLRQFFLRYNPRTAI
ncbi:MAG: ATP-binding protein, partial [SAR324 cluster bacterium]|nr:ATP-binding protein [SAR324 cluster bacterium]